MLRACEITVARAVPTTFSPRYFTKIKSRTILIAQAIPTKHMGRVESPYPRRMALMALYPQIKIFPSEQTVTYCTVSSKDSCGV